MKPGDTCDVRGCTDLATVCRDFSDDGGPREWFMCERHDRESREHQAERAAREEI